MNTSRWLALLLCLCAILSFAGILVAPWLRGSGSVERVNRLNPSMVHAIKSAQAGLPGYLQELEHPQKGQRFAVMGKFGTSEGNEYLWVKDPKLVRGKLEGELDQVPIADAHHKGDMVSVDLTDVVDWLIRDEDGASHGHFTDADNAH